MKLSVHVITDNSERYIKDALDSVVKQKTSFPFEVVIGDDASTDDTFNIIEQFAKEHKNIKAQQNVKNLGILKNFVTTLVRCRGEYVFDLAGDDWLSDENALQILVDKLDQNPTYSFVDSGFDCYFERTARYKRFYNKQNMFFSKNEYKEHQKVYGHFMMGCCFRKNMLLKYVDFEMYKKEGIEFEDYPILTDLVMNTDFGLIPKVLSVYRKHRKSHANNTTSHLETKMFFAKKYNYSKAEVAEIIRINHNHMLHNASLNGDKKEGKKHYAFLRKPMLSNFIYFISSQNSIARKLFNLLRKI